MLTISETHHGFQQSPVKVAIVGQALNWFHTQKAKHCRCWKPEILAKMLEMAVQATSVEREQIMFQIKDVLSELRKVRDQTWFKLQSKWRVVENKGNICDKS